LPRKKIARQAIANSKLIYVEDDQTAIDLINEYGPEHYIVCVANEDFYLENTLNAGSVFIGNYTPESAGDYASGTNHTLPTNGYAKQYSGVNLDSFMKSMTFQKITAEGIQNIGNAIELMAEAEGLQAHKNAVTLRLNSLK
ncbi:MAG: histidinol dehydrogenase, partial [Maribacter sp.]